MPTRFVLSVRSRLFAALSAVAALAACAAAPRQPESGGAAGPRVLVYNMHAGKDAAGRDNLDGIAALVRETGADVVLLQEVDRGTKRSGGVDQPEVLAAKTGYHAAFGSALDFDGGKYGVAILSRWAIKSDTLIHLPVTPPQVRSGGSTEPRGALRVVTASPWGDITVLNTHLDPSGDDKWRLQEAATLVKLIADARRRGGLLLVGGDLNSTPESGAQGMMRGTGLRDSWTECGSGNGFSYPDSVPVKRIDYLYLDTGTRCTSARVIETRVSDHRPVLIDLVVAARSAARANLLDPRVPMTRAQHDWVESTLASLTLRERAGQMVNIWVMGDYANSRDPSFAESLRWIKNDHVGGATMSLGTPIEVAEKINALQRASKVPLMFGSDLEPNLGRLEGGVFTHYMSDAGGATVFPSAMGIAATDRVEDAYAVGRAIGEEAKAVGILVNFAPVVDVNNNPSNPVINTRSFGEDARRVAELSAAFVRGSQDAGVIATLKHFPGHGDTDVDSHARMPVVGASVARLDTVELAPFAAAIDAGAAMVMTAHVALPSVQGDSTTPATLAPKIITGLLRDKLHFSGLAITDAMTMGGIGKGYTTEESSVLAVKSGADVLLKPGDPTRAVDALVAAVERGEISRARIDSSVRRILEVKARTGVAFHPLVPLDTLRDVVGSPEHRALAADIATRAITLLRDRDALVPVSSNGRTVVVQYMPETELRAGKAFAAELRAVIKDARLFKVGPQVDQATLDSISAAARGADRVIIATYVRRIEGEGRFAIPERIAAWIDATSVAEKTVVVSFGNPYLIRQFPRVGSYLVTYGVNDALERSAARAVMARQAISGVSPISLPGFFSRGDGIQRPRAPVSVR